MDIKCRKLTCKYNKNSVCMAKQVDIIKDTDCQTFIIDTEKNVPDNSKTMFNITPEFENYRHIKDIKLTCRANCFFNCNGECMSNGITVICGKEKPICGTFLKKLL